MSSSSGSKKVRTDTAPPTLLPVLLRFGDFSVAVMRTLTLFLTFKGMVPLVSISKEIYLAKIIIFQAPKHWINGDEVREMFCAMLGTAESRWKRRIDTSLVETLMLGVNDFNGRHKTDIVIHTWLQFLENKFPNLLSLNLAGCTRITDATVLELARRCSKLHTLDLRFCSITDASVSEVARRCSNLHTLDLSGCCEIHDASVLEVASRCSNLQTLNLAWCRITDVSVLAVARRCSNLQTLNLRWCRRITDASVMEVARRCSNLHTLDLSLCSNITDASVMEVARRCSNLQTLSLRSCSRITSACKDALRQAHPQLQLND